VETITPETRRATMTTTTKITISIDPEIQGDDRGQLWTVCCSSFPVIGMSEDCESDFDRWVVERLAGTNDEQYLHERETLRDCIYNLGYVIDGFDGDEWILR
jgi:hypothetical protein